MVPSPVPRRKRLFGCSVTLLLQRNWPNAVPGVEASCLLDAGCFKELPMIGSISANGSGGKPVFAWRSAREPSGVARRPTPDGSPWCSSHPIHRLAQRLGDVKLVKHNLLLGSRHVLPSRSHIGVPHVQGYRFNACSSVSVSQNPSKLASCRPSATYKIQAFTKFRSLTRVK
jgi:hypothetical protein